MRDIVQRELMASFKAEREVVNARNEDVIEALSNTASPSHWGRSTGPVARYTGSPHRT